MTDIKIPNTRLSDIAQNGEDLDYWLETNIGLGNWKENYNKQFAQPFRCFSFKREKDAVLFTLRWL